MNNSFLYTRVVVVVVVLVGSDTLEADSGNGHDSGKNNISNNANNDNNGNVDIIITLKMTNTGRKKEIRRDKGHTNRRAFVCKWAQKIAPICHLSRLVDVDRHILVTQAARSLRALQ